RYFHADSPRVTGRSSFLDLNGEIASSIYSPDPDYRIPDEEWLDFVTHSIYWEWTGDGIRATLHVHLDTRRESTEKPRYSIFLEFEDETVKHLVQQDNLRYKHEIGDREGWRSTEQHEQWKTQAPKKRKQ